MQLETTILLLRHAHAEWRADDSRPLSVDGAEAARLVADRLAGQPIAAVYTSPSRRSIETVEPLARGRGLRPEVVPDLRERELPEVLPGNFEALIRVHRRSEETSSG